MAPLVAAHAVRCRPIPDGNSLHGTSVQHRQARLVQYWIRGIGNTVDKTHPVVVMVLQSIVRTLDPSFGICGKERLCQQRLETDNLDVELSIGRGSCQWSQGLHQPRNPNTLFVAL